MRAASRGRRTGKETIEMRNGKFVTLLAAGASAIAFASAVSMRPAVAASDSPFATLAGTWGGSGTARFDDGKSESLRCKGYYTNNGGPHNLGLSIRCANASSKLELRATLSESNGAVSGSWEERTFNQSGTVSGRASANRINLSISGGISGTMTVAISGSSHTVTVASNGASFKGVHITMSR
jgi:hypothetical protein